jgi:choline-sulfatase
MLRTPHFKYTRYLEGEGEELYDMRADPGETLTLIDDPAYAPVLERHRALLAEHLAATDDDFYHLAWSADPRWRSHTPGYRHHVGPAAPMVG